MTPEPAVVTVFRSRLRPEARAAGYDELAALMAARARQMPGLRELKTFTAPDGERLSLIVFDTMAAHEAWRQDPEHLAAQRRGRDELYAEYSITVCRVERQRGSGGQAVAGASSSSPAPDGTGAGVGAGPG